MSTYRILFPHPGCLAIWHNEAIIVQILRSSRYWLRYEFWGTPTDAQYSNLSFCDNRTAEEIVRHVQDLLAQEP